MFYLIGVILCTVLSVVIAQEPTAELLSIRKCEILDGNEIDYKIDVDEAGGNKKVSLDIKLEKEINEEYSFKSTVEIHNGVEYASYMEADGKICDSIEKVAQPAFENLKRLMKPPLTEPCSLHPGEYKLIKYEIDKKDINVPFPTQGKYRSMVRIYDPQQTEIACVEVVAKISSGQDD